MTKPKMLECCECGAAALPSTGRLEHDQRRTAWFDGDSGECPKCMAKLHVYVEPDYAEDRLARPVTAAEYERLKAVQRGVAPASVRCAAREENGEKCRAGIDAGSTWALHGKMKGRWTTVGRRHYCPAHKKDADERAEFEGRADKELDAVMSRARQAAKP